MATMAWNLSNHLLNTTIMRSVLAPKYPDPQKYQHIFSKKLMNDFITAWFED